jgi:hypothetical protein
VRRRRCRAWPLTAPAKRRTRPCVHCGLGTRRSSALRMGRRRLPSDRRRTVGSNAFRSADRGRRRPRDASRAREGSRGGGGRMTSRSDDRASRCHEGCGRCDHRHRGDRPDYHHSGPRAPHAQAPADGPGSRQFRERPGRDGVRVARATIRRIPNGRAVSGSFSRGVERLTVGPARRQQREQVCGRFSGDAALQIQLGRRGGGLERPSDTPTSRQPAWRGAIGAVLGRISWSGCPRGHVRPRSGRSRIRAFFLFLRMVI